MNKRGIAIVFAFVLALGCFFQFSRMDGFLRLDSPEHDEDMDVISHSEGMADLPRKNIEKYLIIYDPQDVESVFARHRIEWMLKQFKKQSVSISLNNIAEHIDSDWRGVLIATGRIGAIRSFSEIDKYVAEGGTAAVFFHPTEEGRVDDEILRMAMDGMGIDDIGGTTNVHGVRLLTDFLIGGEGFESGRGEESWFTASNVRLGSGAKVAMESVDGDPLIWEHEHGKGKYCVFNGSVRDDKANIGILAALIGHCGNDTLIPVLGRKIFFIDDFPAPAPEGNFKRIYDELGMSTVDFYRKVWWPYMRKNAADFNLKYTGVIIESYGDRVNGPFSPAAGRKARDNLIVYGRELLDTGGELGLHGYNHQPLQIDGYLGEEVEDRLDYVGWPNKEEMLASVRELYRYVRDVYPDYEFKAYVPPSDILSPEGHEVVKEAVPSLRVYASILDGAAEAMGYYQDFSRNDDGTYEMPRITAGHCPRRTDVWKIISVVNYIGVFSHFVHPDEIFYEESEGLTWGMMESGLRDFLVESSERYPWLHPATASEGAEYLGDYLDMDYSVERFPDGKGMKIVTENNKYSLSFIMRSEHDIKEERVTGAKIKAIGKGAYLIETTSDVVTIIW
ncbi:MAG: DUF2194 domain-containing protein [Schwartzia sp.]|nr:DUF2194 domain-containing protein [Schwartzia sp. (in: firmicutes)]